MQMSTVYMREETFKFGSKKNTQIYAVHKYTPKTKWFRKITENYFLSGQVGKYKQKETIADKVEFSLKSIKETKKGN